MNIYLDSNVLHTDPFLKKNIQKSILQAIEGIGKFYIAEIVYKEVINNYRKQVRNLLNTSKRNLQQLNTLSTLELSFETLDSEDQYVQSLVEFYDKLQKNGVLEIISHSKYDMFEEIVTRALDNRRPFSDGKEEFKDTVTWLTYAKYAEEQDNYIEHYIITNNTKDFYENKDSNSLHPDLLRDTSLIKPYKDLKDFWDEKKDVFKSIKGYMVEWKTIESFRSKITKEYINKVIEETFFDKLYVSISSFIDENNYHIFREVDSFEFVGIHSVNVESFEADYYDKLLINGELNVEGVVALFDYNSLREKGEDPLIFKDTVDVNLSMDFNFFVDDKLNPYSFNITDIDFINEFALKYSGDDSAEIFNSSN